MICPELRIRFIGEIGALLDVRGRQPIGRPRKKWLDCVIDDIKIPRIKRDGRI